MSLTTNICKFCEINPLPCGLLLFFMTFTLFILSFNTLNRQKVIGGITFFPIFVFMKSFIQGKQALITMLLCGLVTAVSGQTSRALLVAIDNYPEAGGWNEIHATNDIDIVLPMLKANGLRDSEVTMLTDQQATKKNILNALSKIATDSQKGDYIYLQFSMHGQQMLDDNGDEPDGYDEALIPYDAQRKYRAGIYEGENHLRDDELSRFLDRIRIKVSAGGNLTVVFDACHSGSADRDGDDEAYVRGTTYIFAPNNYTPPTINPAKVVKAAKTAKNMAPLTVLSACLPTEINYEYKASDGRYYGTLTYALCSTKIGDTTISEFFNRLTDQVQQISAGRKRKQNPDLQSTHETKTFRIGR